MGGRVRPGRRRSRPGGRLSPPSPAPPGGGGPSESPGQRRPKPSTPRPRTTGRDELSRHPQFADVSPQVGELDEAALATALDADPDAALALLAQLVTATDERLRAAARRLAGRIVLDRVRRGAVRERGTGRPRQVPADRGGDLDLDASADALLGAHGEGRSPGLDELVAREWGRPSLALCLVVDRSGSMTGERLAVAALTAAACALRAPAEHAVVAFAKQVEVLRPLGAVAPPSAVVDEVLQLRGHGTTALAAGLRAATDQLAGARAARRVTLLLSDCRATDGEDPVPAARGVQELLVLAPAEDTEQAAALVAAAGGRWAALDGAAAVPGLLAELLG